MHKSPILKISVFCSSSNNIDNQYFDEAISFGKILAKNGIVCCTGAGNSGLMATVEKSVLDNGGKCIGVIPQFMIDEGWCYQGLTETEVVSTMSERKARLRDICDAIVVLAGGIGTFDEFFEVLTLKQLGKFSKQIIIINTNNYFDELLKLLEKTINENFMQAIYRQMWQVIPSSEHLLEALATN